MSETLILKPAALARQQHKGHRSACEYIPGSQMTAQVYNFHENGDRVYVLNTKLVRAAHSKPLCLSLRNN